MCKQLLSWATQQDLPRGPYHVLKALAWFHTKEHGCFPSQAKLAEHARYSRASVNVHLKSLEFLGYIARTRQTSNKRLQKSTRYTFPKYEASPATALVRSAEAVSENCPEPCPVSGQVRVQKSHTNEYKLSNTTTQKATATATDLRYFGRAKELDRRLKQMFIDEGKEATGFYWRQDQSTPHVVKWICETSLSDDEIFGLVSNHSKKFKTAPIGPMAFDKCIGDKTSSALQAMGSQSDQTVSEKNDAAAFWADLINAGNFVTASAFSNSIRDEILARKLVDPAKMRRF